MFGLNFALSKVPEENQLIEHNKIHKAHTVGENSSNIPTWGNKKDSEVEIETITETHKGENENIKVDNNQCKEE